MNLRGSRERLLDHHSHHHQGFQHHQHQHHHHLHHQHHLYSNRLHRSVGSGLEQQIKSPSSSDSSRKKNTKVLVISASGAASGSAHQFMGGPSGNTESIAVVKPITPSRMQKSRGKHPPQSYRYEWIRDASYSLVTNLGARVGKTGKIHITLWRYSGPLIAQKCILRIIILANHARESFTWNLSLTCCANSSWTIFPISKLISVWLNFEICYLNVKCHISETLKHKDLMVKHLTLRRVPLPWIMISYQVPSTLPQAQIWKWSHSLPHPLNCIGFSTNKPPLLHKILTRGAAQVGGVMVVRQLPASFPDPAGPARHRRRLRHRDNSKP